MVLLLKNLLFTFVVPGTVAVWGPRRIVDDQLPTDGPLVVVAYVLFAIGGAIYAWCLWDFASYGKGTPAPIDAPKKFVGRGLYRIARNPMYVGIITVILGWAAFYGATNVVIYAALLGLAFDFWVRIYEEPHLERTFGREYTEYKSRVRRWIPGRPR